MNIMNILNYWKSDFNSNQYWSFKTHLSKGEIWKVLDEVKGNKLNAIKNDNRFNEVEATFNRIDEGKDYGGHSVSHFWGFTNS